MQHPPPPPPPAQHLINFNFWGRQELDTLAGWGRFCWVLGFPDRNRPSEHVRSFQSLKLGFSNQLLEEQKTTKALHEPAADVIVASYSENLEDLVVVVVGYKTSKKGVA